ncbi:MAG: hypothetical protein RIQ81_1854 [Pseudomonadota bacterium]|jgi:hypothetical protein
MSFMDLSAARPQEVISQYLLELKGKGTMLSYSDHEVVEAWLSAAPALDDLLVVLSEFAPAYFARDPSPRSLGGLKNRVLKRLAQLR